MPAMRAPAKRPTIRAPKQPARGSVKRVWRRVLRITKAILFLALMLSAGVAYRVWPRPLNVSSEARFPVPQIQNNRLVLVFSPEIACAQIASFDDQMEAYLHFEYLRGRDPEDAWRLVLTAAGAGNSAPYKIYMVVENDLLTATQHLDGLENFGLVQNYELLTWTKHDLDYAEAQSQLFEAAYNMPTPRKLETLPSFQLLPALAQFLTFKSQTDWRVINRYEAAPQPLTREQAMRIAADILVVAHFYSLPLDYFLGVGAMENNYMDADGDLTHTVWKRRPQRGDLVLAQRRKRVLVSDYSIGAWQISRESVRRAHELYLQDKRNYDLLPARLQPAKQLDFNTLNDEVLTTYAGLLLRDLLDRFDGDVDKAIGAYNGGVRTPNPAYAAAVKNVALYARKVLEHAPAADPQLTDNPQRSGASQPPAHPQPAQPPPSSQP